MIRTLISIALLAILAACANSPDGRSAAQQRLDGFRTAYLGANLAIAGYALLKPCEEGVQAPCSDLNALSQMRTYSNLVGVALEVAQAAVATPEAGTTLDRVNAALLALTKILTDYRLR